MKTMADVIPDLEALVAWAKANPELMAMSRFTVHLHLGDDVELAAMFARSVPKTEKVSIDETMWLTHPLNPLVLLAASVHREAVCERVVVGTRAVPEKTTPAHTEEIVEWKCGSILAAAP